MKHFTGPETHKHSQNMTFYNHVFSLLRTYISVMTTMIIPQDPHNTIMTTTTIYYFPKNFEKIRKSVKLFFNKMVYEEK